MLSALYALLMRLLPPPFEKMPEDSATRVKRHARRAVARNAEGNVRLSLGRYQTQADLDARFEKIKHADFG